MTTAAAFSFRQAAPAAPLIFLHIPKAAGSTMNSLIRMQVKRRDIKDFWASRVPQEVRAFIEAPDAERHRYRAFLGHVPFGLHRFLAPKAGYAAILRDPVDRLISDFDYIKRTPTHKAHQKAQARGFTLNTLLEERIAQGRANLQTLWLSGVLDLTALDRQDQTSTESDAALLGRAKANIEAHFFAIAPLEAFDAFAMVLAGQMGWRAPTFARRNVARARREALDPALRARIEEATATDHALYTYVQHRFAEQVAHSGLRAQDMQALGRRNAVFGLLDGLRRTVRAG